jgi:hypothetical protein
MLNAFETARVIEFERELLRQLCGPETDISSSSGESQCRARIIASLRNHKWRDPEHRIVFEALEKLPGGNSYCLQQRLPAQATRMGFPDVNWQIYFGGASAWVDTETADKNNAAIESLVANLLAACRETAL